MTTPVPILDHVVINVADQLDEASTLYNRLGFQLTARGHHTLGSSNHLAIFDENYLELLGYEADRGDKRKELWQAPLGLTGLVWKTQDADNEFHHLQKQGLAGDPPASFSRPVTLPGGEQTDARFRTVRVRQDRVPNGRSFFCQHFTPQAVWQRSWQEHANGVQHISEFLLVAEDPLNAAQVYSQLFGEKWIQPGHEGSLLIEAGKATVRIAPAAYFETRFGDLPRDYNGTTRMVALSLRTDSLEKVRKNLLQGNVLFHEDSGGVIVGADNAFNLALRFHL